MTIKILHICHFTVSKGCFLHFCQMTLSNIILEKAGMEEAQDHLCLSPSQGKDNKFVSLIQGGEEKKSSPLTSSPLLFPQKKKEIFPDKSICGQYRGERFDLFLLQRVRPLPPAFPEKLNVFSRKLIWEIVVVINDAEIGRGRERKHQHVDEIAKFFSLKSKSCFCFLLHEV